MIFQIAAPKVVSVQVVRRDGNGGNTSFVPIISNKGNPFGNELKTVPCSTFLRTSRE